MSACPYRSRDEVENLCPECDAEDIRRQALLEQAVRDVGVCLPNFSWWEDLWNKYKISYLDQSYVDDVRAEFRRLEREHG